MKKITLKAQVRELTGKKVRKLRLEGGVPMGVYGKGVESVSLSAELGEFAKVYNEAGETSLVELQFNDKTLPVLIKNVQIHALTRKIVHAELHAVNLKEKIKANVPVELVGESPAVQNNVGVLLQTLNEIEVEALPADLPEKIEADVANLAEIDQQIIVSDLKAISGVTFLTEAAEIIVKVAPAVSEETAKELAAAEAAKTAEEAIEGEGKVGAESGEQTVEKSGEGKSE
jgi:large subunit ribosomal protein L25